MNGALRDSGIAVIGNVRWGTHFCQFYASKEDLIDILVPYFKAGLENNEFCMWVTSEPLELQEAEAALRDAVPDLDRYQAAGAIEIVSYADWYLKGGTFEQNRVLNDWVKKHDDARARGYDGLRLTGNTFWLEKAACGLERGLWRDFHEYEAAVDSVIGHYHMIANCTYSLEQCSASDVIDVLQTHQFALIKREGSWVMVESSERKRAAEQLDRLNAVLMQRSTELEAANKELEAFSYSVSHDLRAPLRAIDGFSLALQQDYDDKLDEEGRKYLRWIREGARDMGQLIDDMLRLSRVTRGELQRVNVDLSALAHKIDKELREKEPERAVDFVVQEALHAEGDPRMLETVLQNLLENAWKFTAKRKEARIEFAMTEVDGRPAYFVRDNGAGFPMEYVDRLFQPFQRLHKAEEFAGTGIGLAIVQRVIHRHGGKVWAEGAVERGATFYFSLPAGE